MTLLKLIHEDWIAHGRDWTKPGFRAVAICRFGQWRMESIHNRWVRIPLNFLYRFLYRRARNTYGIELPYTVKLGRRVVIEHQGDIVVHGCSEIGDDTIIRQGVTIGNRYLERALDAPTIGRMVNIGAGAKILGKITISDKASIGANSVVLSDVEESQTVVGIPAKPLALD